MPFLVQVGFIAAVLTAVGASVFFKSDAGAAPDGFASPINGGCYITAPNVCKLHVDPFTININDGAGAKLVKFSLYANGNPIYNFQTDVSNPPGVDYTPSLVAMDFAASCGVTYYMNLVAQDTTDANPLNYGQTKQFTCPLGVP